MSISVRCSQCQKEYRVDDRLAGKKARCKQCGAILSVPEPITELTEADMASDDPFAAIEQLESAKVMEKKFTPNISPAAIGSESGGVPKPSTVASPPTGVLLPAPQMVGPVLPPQQAYQPRPRKKYESRAPVEGATPMLVLGYLVWLVAVMVWMIVQIYGEQMTEGLPQQVVKSYHFSMMGVALTRVGIHAITFFLMLTPIVMLAVYLGGQVMKFGMPDGFYLKSAGLAALPGLMVTLALVLPPAPVLKACILVGILPVCFYVLMYAFGLDWEESGVTFAFLAMLYVGGWWTQGKIVELATQSTLESAMADLRSAEERVRDEERRKQWASQFPGRAYPGAGVNMPNMPSGPVDLVGDRIRALRERIVNASQDRMLANTTREDYIKDLEELFRQARALKDQRDDQTTQDLFTLLEDARKKAVGLPSKAADDEVFQPLAATEEWSPADPSNPILGDEVTFRRFKLRPLKETLLDLRSSESSDEGLAWMVSRRDGHGRMQVALVPKSNPKQRRPWITQKSFQQRAAEDAKLLAIDGSQAGVTTGALGTLKFTRVAMRPGDHGFERWVKYIAEDGSDWLVVTLITGKDDAQLMDSLETAVRTIRRQRGGEQRADPFSAERMAARLADNPEGAMAILRRIGKSAEGAVLPYLKSDDPRVRESAAMLLGDIGTDKSLPALRELAKGKGKDRRLAEIARKSWKKLAPKEIDSVDEAMMDLESEDWQVQRTAMETLAKEKADERREKIAPVLEEHLMGEKGFFTHEQAAKALQVWYNSRTAAHLIPFLNDSRNEHDRKLDSVIAIVAATRDPQGVHPIIQWLLLRTQAVKLALEQMGPVAEDEVLKLTEANVDPKLRVAAAEILEQIGGAKTVKRIAPFTRDKRDPTVNAAMTAAYEAARKRAEAPRK